MSFNIQSLKSLNLNSQFSFDDENHIDLEFIFNNIFDLLKLYGENKAIGIIQSQFSKYEKLKNYKINIVNQLIEYNYFEIAHLFIIKKFSFYSYRLSTLELSNWLNANREKYKLWIQQCEPIHFALSYVINNNDTELFDLLMKKAPFDTSIKEPIFLACKFNRIYMLNMLLKNLNELLPAEHLDVAKSDDCAILLLKFLPSNSTCIDYLIKNKNFRALILYIDDPKNAMLPINSYALKKCRDPVILNLLITKCKMINIKIVELYIQNEKYDLLKLIIQNLIPIEVYEDFIVNTKECELLWIDQKTASMFMSKIGNEIPLNYAFKEYLLNDHIELVVSLLKNYPDIEIDKNIFYSMITDKMCLLFSNYDFIFDDSIITHLIKINANTFIKDLYYHKKYVFNENDLQIAITQNNYDIVCLLLNDCIALELKTISLALSSTETILDLVLNKAKKTSPDALSNFCCDTLPANFNYKRLEYYTYFFNSINKDALLTALSSLDDCDLLDCCKFLNKKGFDYSDSLIEISTKGSGKPLTFSWLMEHYEKDQLCIVHIDEFTKLEDLLIKYTEKGNIYFAADCFGYYGNAQNIPINLLKKIFFLFDSNASWLGTFNQYTSFFREFIKIMRASTFYDWYWKPVNEFIKLANQAGPINLVHYVINFLNFRVNIHNTSIWDMIREHIINKCMPFSDCLYSYQSSFFNICIFDVYNYLKKLCIKHEESIEYTALYAFKFAYIFESLSDVKRFFKHYLKTHSNLKSPIKNSCYFYLPTKPLRDKNFWVNLIALKNYPAKFFKIIYMIPCIEEAILGPLPSKSEYFKTCDSMVDAPKITDYYIEKIKQISPQEWPKGKLKKQEKRILKWAYCQKYLKEDIEEFKRHKVSIIKHQTASHLFEEASLKLIEKIDTEKPFHELLNFIIKRRDLASYEVEELVSLTLKLIYKNIPNHLFRFAIYCCMGGISNNNFNKILSLLRCPKKQDFLPEIVVENELYPNYILKKIAFINPYSLVLGIPTVSCQNIGANGEKVTLHGYESAFGGFYYLENKNKEPSKNSIIAAAWAGITEKGELIFDSVEVNPFYSSQMVADFFKKAAIEIINEEPSITAVLVGDEGNTPEALKTEAYLEPFSKIIGYETLGYDSCIKRFILAKKACSIKILRFSEAIGIDHYIIVGRKVRDLIIHPLDRIQFWKEHGKVYKLLRAHRNNPLLEEGYTNFKTRDHQGEFFLTDVALLRLQQHLVPSSIFINFNKRTPEFLPFIMIGNSLCIGCLENIHASCCYIENVNGQIKAFIIDSEGSIDLKTSLLQIIRRSYPEAKVIFSTTKLQLDYYSCGVFMLKTLRYFYKEGINLFSQIDNNELIMLNNGYYALKAEKIPPKLLKMAQCPIIYESNSPYAIKLPDTILNSIVSEKKNITLRQYLEVYQFRAQRIYSTAALRIKYRYFRLLETLLG